MSDMATGQFAAHAPRDFLSAEYPNAGGVVFDMGGGRPVPGLNPVEAIATDLRVRYGIRAWVGWMGDDGFLRVVARVRP